MIAQMEELHAKHDALELVQEPGGQLRVWGPVGFTIEHDGHTITDTYRIDLHLPDDYPDSPPSVYETEGKVPKDFGHFMEAGNFCLGPRVDVRRRFAANPTLLGFIDDLVIPYLFSNSYKLQHGTLPYGEYDHGSLGLVQYYKSHFGEDLIPTLRLLKCLADQFAPPIGPCPCGNGRKLKDCHGPKLDELRPHLSHEWFEHELRNIINACKAVDIDLPNRDVMPQRMWKQKQSRLRKEAKARKRKGKNGRQ